MKRIIFSSIHPPSIIVTNPTARSFGTIVSVISRMEVTAWNSVTTTPTTMQVRRIGALIISAVSMVYLAR